MKQVRPFFRFSRSFKSVPNRGIVYKPIAKFDYTSSFRNSVNGKALGLVSVGFLLPTTLQLESEAVDEDEDDYTDLWEPRDFLTDSYAIDRAPNWFQTWYKKFQAFVLEPLAITRRFIYLFVVFLPVILSSPILILGYFSKKDQEAQTTLLWYRLLVAQMERAGPTFVKLGQWAGSRTDLFSASLCTLLGKLHSNNKAHSLRYTKRAIERAFSKPFDTIFKTFDEKPLGVGAIAQVYTATLNEDLIPPQYVSEPKSAPARKTPATMIGPKIEELRPPNYPDTKVAIKVLHPGVEKMIRRDLAIMAFFASVLNTFPGMEWLSFPEEVAVFRELMLSQADLRIEANNLKTFEAKFLHRPTVEFPRAMPQYTSRKLLTEEFEYAVPLEYFLNKGAGSYDKRIARLGLNAYLNMLLIDNFVHADLHPGNIMIKFFKPTTRGVLNSIWATWRQKYEPNATQIPPNNTQTDDVVAVLRKAAKAGDTNEAWLNALEDLDRQGYEPAIVFIDTGLVSHLTPQNRRNFIDLFAAIASFDGYKAGRLMVERCRSPNLVVDQELFALRVQNLVLNVKSETFSLGQVHIGDVLANVMKYVRQHHVKMEADFVNTILSMLLLEGIGRQLDPDLDLLKSSIPILRKLGVQMGREEVLSSAKAGGVDKSSISDLSVLFKFWVLIELRNMADVSLSEVDDYIKYDVMTPNV